MEDESFAFCSPLTIDKNYLCILVQIGVENVACRVQILRLLADGDKCDVIYLPPRNAGDRLPVELLEAYDGHCSFNCFYYAVTLLLLAFINDYVTRYALFV